MLGEGLLSGTSLKFPAQVTTLNTTTLKLEEACENGPFPYIYHSTWASLPIHY